MRPALSALLSLLLLLPCPALARDSSSADESVAASKASQGSVAVVIVSKDISAAEAAATFESALAKGIDGDGRLASVDLLKAVGGALPEAQTDPKVQEAFTKGKDAFDSLDLDTASTEFMSGLKLLVGAPLTAKPAEVARSLTWIGASYLLNGAAGKAAESFSRATIMAPSFVPDANEFSPDVLAAFNDAKAKVASGPKGNLTVTSSASPARVLVDGTDRGIAPVTFNGLPAGRHHVAVESRGHAPWAAFVEVSAGGTATAAAEIPALADAGPFNNNLELAQGELKETKPGPGVRELASQLQARYVVIGVARSGVGASSSIELVAFDVSAERRAVGLKKDVRVGSPSFDSDTRTLASRVVDGLLKPEAAVAEASSVPLTERSWFWPTVGAVGGAIVVGAVAGIVVAAMNQHPQAGPLVTGIP